MGTARASRAWPSWMATESSCWAKLSPASARRTLLPGARKSELGRNVEPSLCVAQEVQHRIPLPKISNNIHFRLLFGGGHLDSTRESPSSANRVCGGVDMGVC